MAIFLAQPQRLPRRAIVFGGRYFTDSEYLFDVLDREQAAEPFECIIEGGQRTRDPVSREIIGGADYWAKQWASWRGVPVHTVKADWSLGKKGGPIRNQRMIEEYRATEGIGFPGGRGTADMLSKLKAAGLDWKQVGRICTSTPHQEPAK